MPELPEVEQVRISLVPHVVGRTITAVQVDVPKMVHHPGVEEFRKTWRGGPSPPWGGGASTCGWNWMTAAGCWSICG